MDLYVDIGNTAIKFGCVSNKEMEVLSTINTEWLVKSEYPLDFDFPTAFVDGIKRVFISSVAPKACRKVVECFENLDKDIYFINPNDDAGVKINIDDPNELGSDLLADLAAGYALYGSPLLIIDLGTVTKLLFIDKNATFSTCSFLPGFELTFRTLGQNTELLPKVNMGRIKPLLENHNTNDVILASTYYSHIDMLNGMVKRYQREVGYPFKVVITGGNASYIKESKEVEFEFDLVDNLCLKGIKIIVDRKG